jgi:Flavin containing amine oxidoreductase
VTLPWWLQVNGKPGSPWPSLLFLDRVVGAPIVVAFNFGDQARRLEAASDAQCIEEAMGVIRASFGADVPDPVAHLVTR